MLNLRDIWEREDKKAIELQREKKRQEEAELISSIPAEVWITVFRFLSPSAILHIRLVCKKWNCCATDNSLWSLFWDPKGAITPTRYYLNYFRDQRWLRQQNEEMKALDREKALLQQQHNQTLEECKQYFANHPNEPRTCSRCKQEYLEILNTVTSCMYHVGYLDHSNLWNCCFRVFHESGCVTSKHTLGLKLMRSNNKR